MSWCSGELVAQSAGDMTSRLLDELATQQVGGSRNEWYDDLAVFRAGAMSWWCLGEVAAQSAGGMTIWQHNDELAVFGAVAMK